MMIGMDTSQQSLQPTTNAVATSAPKFAKLVHMGTRVLLYSTLFLAGYIAAKLQTLLSSL